MLTNAKKMPKYPNQLPEIIAKVIDLVTRMLDSEMAGVMLYNQDTNELVLQKPAFRVTNDEVINTYRVPLNNDSNTANVYLTGEPYISNDSRHDFRLRQKFVKLFNSDNCITIPLEIEQRRIGILHISNKKSGKFTEDDLDILSFLTSHVAIFIENTIIHERERRQAEELADLNAKLQAHHASMEKIFAVHNHLIHQVLNEDGMSLMVKTLADLLGAPVFIEDNHSNLLISSHPGEIVPTRVLLQEQGKMFLLGKGQAVISAPYLYGDRQVTRVTAPIGEARYPMGYLSMLIQAETKPSDVKMLAFEQGTMALALEMMKDRIKFETESRFRSEFFDDLFAEKHEDIENIKQRADFFQYDLGKSSRVVVISLDEDEGTGKKNSDDRNYALYQGFHHLVSSAVQKTFPGSMAAGKRNCVEVLLPVAAKLNQDALQQKLAEVRERLTAYSTKGRILIGVGGECRYFDDYHRSYHQARKALAIGDFLTQQNGVVIYDQLGIYSLLFEISDLDLLRKIVTDKLGPLLDYDEKKGSDLVNTLEVYLKTGGGLKETAQILFIHVATVKYRISRIQEFIQVDLRKTKNHFDLQLALFTHRYLTKKQAD